MPRRGEGWSKTKLKGYRNTQQKPLGYLFTEESKLENRMNVFERRKCISQLKFDISEKKKRKKKNK